MSLPIESLSTRKAKRPRDRKSTRLNSSHEWISYAVFCLKKNLISTTYGADGAGNQDQSFAPSHGPSGHRRRNLLFARSKKRTVVFSSLDPERIQTTANSPWGVRALKQYLIYARTGILQQADDGLDQPTNDFERAVGAVLQAKGYDVEPQVGVAGCF